MKPRLCVLFIAVLTILSVAGCGTDYSDTKVVGGALPLTNQLAFLEKVKCENPLVSALIPSSYEEIPVESLWNSPDGIYQLDQLTIYNASDQTALKKGSSSLLVEVHVPARKPEGEDSQPKLICSELDKVGQIVLTSEPLDQFDSKDGLGKISRGYLLQVTAQKVELIEKLYKKADKLRFAERSEKQKNTLAKYAKFMAKLERKIYRVDARTIEMRVTSITKRIKGTQEATFAAYRYSLSDENTLRNSDKLKLETRRAQSDLVEKKKTEIR